MMSPRRGRTTPFDERTTLVAARPDELALRLGAFFAVGRFVAVAFLAVAFLAVAFLAVAFFVAVVLLAVAFFAGTVCLPIFPISIRTPHPRLNLVTRPSNAG